LAGAMLAFLVVSGCQQGPVSSEESLRHEVEGQLVASCDGCDTRMIFTVSPQDIITARDPSGNKELYLTVVDKDGKPVECCHSPMRVMVDENGKLMLKCPHCGKLKPIAVKNGKVYVE
jgi:hypothetical protein